jgi:hypothetical protein
MGGNGEAMKRSKWFLIALLLVLPCLVHAGERFLPTGATGHMHVAQMGMGGVTSVIHTNAHTLFYNPAMLARQSFSLEITPVQTVYGVDMADVIKWADDNSDKIQDFESLTDAEKNAIIRGADEFDNKWMPVNLAPYIGFASKNFAIGGYGVAQGDVKIDEGAMIPKVGLRGYTDAVIGLGIGMKKEIFGQKLDVGVAGRYINRRVVQPRLYNVWEANDLQAIADTLQDEFKDAKSGFGIDLGVGRDFQIGPRPLTFGLVVQDLYGSLDGYIKPKMNIGALYPLVEKGSGNFLVKRLDCAVELTDAMNRQGTNLFSHLNMGMEMNMLAGLLKLRGGFHQGYPVYGAGLSLAFLKIDYAYYTEEMGTSPGQYPQSAHRGQVSLGW